METTPQTARRPPIQGLWVRGPLPPIQELSIRSFLANGHGYDLYSYDEVPNLPPGARLLPGALILPEEQIFRMKGSGRFRNNLAPFADIFRYKLLFEHGGWWADLDFVCLRPFDLAAEWVFASERAPDGTQVKAISIIKAPVGSLLMAELYERSRAHPDRDQIWGAVGAHLFHPAIAKRGLSRFTQPPEVFCPLDWWRAAELFKPGEIPRGAHAIHLWNSLWSQSGWKQEPNYAPEVLYQKLHLLYPAAGDVVGEARANGSTHRGAAIDLKGAAGEKLAG